MSKNTENRFVGTNWDDIKVSVGETSARKVITKGKDTMEVCTRAMGGFKQTLSDKKVKLASLPKKDEETENEDEGEKDEEVTPDQLVTCPKCHKRFRVGKKAAKGE